MRKQLRLFLLHSFSMIALWGLTRFPMHAQQIANTISSKDVTSIASDSKGCFWFGTKHGLDWFNGTTYLSWKASKDIRDLNSDYIYDLMTDGQGTLWIGTQCGLSVYRNSEMISTSTIFNEPFYKSVDLDESSIITSTRHGIVKIRKSDLDGINIFHQKGMSKIRQFTCTPQKEIWIPYNIDGRLFVKVLDQNLGEKADYDLCGEKDVIAAETSPDNCVWIVTGNDIFIFDGITGKLLKTPALLQEIISGSAILFVSKYQSRSMLIGIRDKGFFTYDPYSQSVARIHPDYTLPEEKYVCGSDPKGNIFLSDGESYPAYIPVTSYSINYTLPTEGDLLDIGFDKDGNLWYFTGKSIGCYDIRSKRILFSTPNSGEEGGFIMSRSGSDIWAVHDINKLRRYSISSGKASLLKEISFEDDINSLAEDGDGTIWAALPEQVCHLTPGEYVPHYIPKSDSLLFILQLIGDKGSGEIIGLRIGEGVFKASYLTKDSMTEGGNEGFLAISSVLTARDGTKWVGTIHDGIVKIDTLGQVFTYTSKDGLTENTVQAIEEDLAGNIWFSTPSLITKFDKVSGTFQTIIDERKPEDVFYARRCSAVSSQGDVYFGGGKVLTCVRNAQMLPSDERIGISLIKVFVNGEDAGSGRITLKHTDKILQFFFGGNDFRAGSKLNYAVMMEGYNDDWIWTDDTQASFTNLPPGKYTFRVKVRNSNGRWSPDELAVPLVVKPSFWNSIVAKLLYVLLGIGLIAGGIAIYIKRKLFVERLSLSKKREELDKEHIDFITNISHEYRTPLSLLYAPLKQLLSSDSLSGKDRKLLQTMESSAEKLLSLTDIILNAGTGKENKLELKVSPVNISAFSHDIAEEFRMSAAQRDLSLTESVQEGIEGFIDKDKSATILFNLFSNAIKYTPEGGSIQFDVNSDGNEVHFTVKDTGPGIPEEKRRDLFGRFKRLGDDENISGSGIGLNFSMELAHLHKGEINYSDNSPVGSVFTLTIPVSRDAYKDDEFLLSKNGFTDPDENAEKRQGESKGKILLVEDNQEVRLYLRDLLSPDYDVEQCANGMEAIERISLSVPDIVLSDIMMPYKDGYELCREIKSSEDYSHIPVILLTGKTENRSGTLGMESGADAFIPKPFDPSFLISSIDSILRNRRILQNKVQKLTSSSTMQETEDSGLSPQERRFLENVHKVIDRNMSGNDLSVDLLCKEVGASHTSLYAKIKSLTGLSPKAYINEYRLNYAMQMLRSGEFTVSETAYSVGASSVSNFSRDFKHKFGVSPKEVIGQ